jgi:RNA polymerase sigma-70 factor (ECF subfamily)
MLSPIPPPHDVLQAARAGCREALGELLQAYRPLLLLLANQRLPTGLRGKGGASDLVQETLADAAGSFGQFHGRTVAEFRAWLKQILRHNASDFVHHFAGVGKRRVDAERPLHGLAEQLADAAPSPVEEVLRRERLQVMERALERLHEGDRQVIYLHHREHLPFEQVARLLNCSEPAVRRRWERAIEHWRQEVNVLYADT